jgi:DNA-binding XRE family transcriptional regulator
MRLQPKGGAKIKRERLKKRWSQRDLGQLVRRRHMTISLLETGKMTTCTRELAENICFHLGIEVEDVFELEEEPRPAKVATGRSTSGRKSAA